MSFLNSPEDIRWLLDVHLKPPPSFTIGSALLFGNEDAPTRVDVFKDSDPSCYDVPNALYLQDAGGDLVKLPERFPRLATNAYVEAMLWTESDWTEENRDDTNWLDQGESYSSFSVANRSKILEDVLDFIQSCGPELILRYLEVGTPEQFGHDFWLTRNHHGAGFWDRGYGEIGEVLTELAHAAGGRGPYRGDDGNLYYEN